MIVYLELRDLIRATAYAKEIRSLFREPYIFVYKITRLLHCLLVKYKVQINHLNLKNIRIKQMLKVGYIR